MSPQTRPELGPATERRKRTVLTIAVVCSACTFIAAPAMSPVVRFRSPGHCGEFFILAFPCLLALIPHIDVLARLWSKQPLKGVMLALAMGLGGLVVTLLALAGWLRGAWLIDTKVPLLIAAAQAAVLGTAARAYTSIRQGPGERRPTVWAGGTLLAYLALILVLGWIANPSLDNPGQRFARNHSRAVRIVRNVNLLELEFSQTSGGYSPTLQALVSTEKGATAQALPQYLRELLTLQEDEGYVYTYIPGPPDAAGHIRTYRFSARPRQHSLSGCLSLYTDESGVVHATEEDRAATAQDP